MKHETSNPTSPSPFFSGCSKGVLVLLLLLAPCLLAADEPADEPAAEPADPRLTALQAELDLLNKRLELLKARRELIGLHVPDLPTERQGSVKAEGDAPVESQIIAYEALEKIACQIAQRLPAGDLVIHNESELSAITELQAFGRQLDQVETAFGGLPPELLNLSDDPQNRGRQIQEFLDAQFTESVTSLFPGVAISTALEVFSLFRTNVAVTSKALTLAQEALIAELAAATRARPAGSRTCDSQDGTRVIHNTAAFPLGLLETDSPFERRMAQLALTSRDVDRMIRFLEAARAARAQRIAAISRLDQEITALEKEIEELETAGASGQQIAVLVQRAADKRKEKQELERTASKGQLQAENRLLEREVVQARTAKELYAGVLDVLMAKEKASGLNLMARLIRAERLKQLLEGGAHTLQLKVVAAGGSVKTAQNFFRSSIWHSGGAVVTFLVYDKDGTISESDNLRYRPGYRNFKDSAWAGQPQ